MKETATHAEEPLVSLSVPKSTRQRGGIRGQSDQPHTGLEMWISRSRIGTARVFEPRQNAQVFAPARQRIRRFKSYWPPEDAGSVFNVEQN